MKAFLQMIAQMDMALEFRNQLELFGSTFLLCQIWSVYLPMSPLKGPLVFRNFYLDLILRKSVQLASLNTQFYFESRFYCLAKKYFSTLPPV